MAAILDVKGLSAWYGQIRALYEVDLSIEQGGVTALLGANGAGKTTTLRAICNVVRRSGTTLFDGKDIARLSTEDIVRLGIGQVPEGRGTFTGLTVEENLRLAFHTRKDRAAAYRDMDLVFELFPRLKERVRQQAGTLSGGEQQMLAVGRALMLSPRLMLLDEPSFGLAPLVVQEIFRILRRINEEQKVSMLIVEQNAAMALELADHVYLLETGRVVTSGPSEIVRNDETLRKAYLGTDVEFFIQQLVAGLTSGAIYACVALGLVMIFVSTDHINFAQGEMAMFATYLAWAMIDAGVPYWLAFILTIFIAFAAGLFIQRVILKPLETAPVLSLVVCFIALLSFFNALAGMIWSFTIKQFPSPFPPRDVFGNGLVSIQQIGVVAVTLIMLGILTVFFRYTTLGLAMRAAAQNPASARLMGVRVSWMLALGWGLAASIGAVAGMLVAPIVFLDPNMMTGILVYGFAGALVGGIGNPLGAVAGGFIVGVLENLVGSYVIGNELKLTFALAVVVGVLLLKPAGIFGRVIVRRV